ncbi:hypothetical protein [Bacillus nitratireducens]|uniref:hypothetical protein n=1 Tax=Bacillus nitratireducens TaxID=2026193 RepID=UPI000B80C1B6|nr:hypothetical protein [Bacillus nitratireducens]
MLSRCTTTLEYTNIERHTCSTLCIEGAKQEVALFVLYIEDAKEVHHAAATILVKPKEEHLTLELLY